MRINDNTHRFPTFFTRLLATGTASQEAMPKTTAPQKDRMCVLVISVSEGVEPNVI